MTFVQQGLNTAIPVFSAFLTRSVPLTLVISMVLPILMQTVIQLVSPMMISAPDAILYILAMFPSFQGIYMTSSDPATAILLIALAADIVWAALLTVIGILRFKKADVK